MKVVMVVNNPCVSDARVIREAEALAEGGHEVVVLAVWNDGLPAEEVQNGVMYCRPPYRGIIIRRKISDTNAAVSKGSSPLARGLIGSLIPVKATNYNRKYTKENAPIPLKLARVLVNAARLTIRAVRLTIRAMRRVTIINVVTPSVVELIRCDRLFRDAILYHRPDVVHAHDLYTLHAASVGARLADARLVYDSHELETGRNGISSRWHRWVRWRIEQYLIRRTDAVITVCDSIADYLRDFYMDRPKVVLNAPHEESMADGSETVRDRLGLDHNVPLAVYVGSVTINRGLENSVEALVHMPELHLALLGPRNDVVEDSLLDRARRLDVTDRLHLIDPVPHYEVTGVLAGATVSLILIQNVCLSYYFCFPNKLLESLLGGLPVVASRLVELERVVGETRAGMIVDETDPKAIAAGIRSVADNREKYVPDAGTIDFIRRKYGWDVQKQRLLELYDELATGDRKTVEFAEAAVDRKDQPELLTR